MQQTTSELKTQPTKSDEEQVTVKRFDPQADSGSKDSQQIMPTSPVKIASAKRTQKNRDNPRTPKQTIEQRLSPDRLADIQVNITPASTKEVNLTMQTKSMKELSNQHTVSRTVTQY